MLDEFIHHGAEISMLRDLWRWQHPLGVDPDTERAMRGDPALLADIDQPNDPGALMGVAAAYARWEIVIGFLDARVAVPTGGTTPLHLAAGAGELRLVRRLVEAGADTRARDPEFNAIPREWANFLQQPHLADWLGKVDERD